MSGWRVWDEFAAEVYPEGGGQRVALCGSKHDETAMANARLIAQLPALQARIERLQERIRELEVKLGVDSAIK